MICLQQHSHERIKILGYALLLPSIFHDTRTIKNLLEKRSRERSGLLQKTSCHSIPHKHVKQIYQIQNTTIRTDYHFTTFKNYISFHCECVLIKLAQQDPVINATSVTIRQCDGLAQMEHSDDFSTFGRPFQTTWYF